MSNYKNFDERIDLDNQMVEISKNFPKSEDDLLFYVRAKMSTNELFVLSKSNNLNLIIAFSNMANQNPEFKEILQKSLEISLNDFLKKD
jgi:hypothetical protein